MLKTKLKSGVITIVVLWILMALTTMAFTAISIARWQLTSGRNQLFEAKAIALIQSAAYLAHETNFDFSEKTFEFITGKVSIKKILNQKEDFRLRCTATVGHRNKIVEISWERTGDLWSVHSWKEFK